MTEPELDVLESALLREAENTDGNFYTQLQVVRRLLAFRQRMRRKAAEKAAASAAAVDAQTDTASEGAPSDAEQRSRFRRSGRISGKHLQEDSYYVERRDYGMTGLGDWRRTGPRGNSRGAGRPRTAADQLASRLANSDILIGVELVAPRNRGTRQTGVHSVPHSLLRSEVQRRSVANARRHHISMRAPPTLRLNPRVVCTCTVARRPRMEA